MLIMLIKPALHRWQRLSVLLFQKGDDTEDGILQPPDAIQPQVDKLKDVLNPILSKFVPADHESRYRQSEQFEQVIWAGARLGYRILSQSCRWSFNWHINTAWELAVLPGLVKLSNELGEMLEQSVPVGLPTAVLI
jgi:hypothetical protein